MRKSLRRATEAFARHWPVALWIVYGSLVAVFVVGMFLEHPRGGPCDDECTAAVFWSQIAAANAAAASIQ